MRTVFDNYNAKTVTPSDIEKLQEEYGYNDLKELCEFITAIYLENNPNFSYDVDVLMSSEAFENYYNDCFIYDFDEWSCISWFIKDNVFHTITYDDGNFGVTLCKLTVADPRVIGDIRIDFNDWEVKV